MVGQQINDIPVVANRSTMFEYAVREVVDEVFIFNARGPDLQIQKTSEKNFEEMGITVNLNIRLYELDVNSRVKYLNKIGGYPTITFAQGI